VKKSARTNVMPRGFWQREMAHLLADGPRPRKEITAILSKRFPEKHKNLFVVFATMLRNKELVETDGIFALPQVSPPVAPTV
jgi:hypothetical protein